MLTGGSGFIGQHLARRLRMRHVVLAPTHAELDLTNPTAVRAYFVANPVDVVVHNAAKPGYRNAPDSDGALESAFRMLLNLLRERDHYVRLVLIGSGAVYDTTRPLVHVAERILGSAVPQDGYGFAKFAAACLAEPLDFVVELRPFGVYGPGEDYAIRFISNAICKTLFDLPITMHRDRTMSYLWVEDLGTVVEHFVDEGSSGEAAYNVVPNEVVTLRRLADLVLAVSGKHLPVVVAESGDGPKYTGSNSRLLRKLPELRFTSIEDGVARLYSHYAAIKTSIDPACLLVDL